MAEKEKLDRIDLAVNSTFSRRIYPNVVGQFRAVSPTGVTYYVPTGLCPGSADRIGFQTVKITPDMVGRYIAQIVSIEGKDTEKSSLRPGQAQWRDIVNEFGGAAMITHQPEEVIPKLYELSRGKATPPDHGKLAQLFAALKEQTKKKPKTRRVK